MHCARESGRFAFPCYTNGRVAIEGIMHRTVAAISLLAVSACAPWESESAPQQAIPDSGAAYAIADYACRNAGKMTVIESVDRDEHTVTLDCVKR